MKRMQILSVNLVLATMGLAFVCLASPAIAAGPCLGLGEYYSYARQCAPRGTVVGGEAWLLVLAALLGISVGMMSLRRRALRRD